MNNDKATIWEKIISFIIVFIFSIGLVTLFDMFLTGFGF